MTFRPFPPRPGAGGGGGSYDDTALRARVAAGETTNATQDGTLRDHAGRLLKIEETPPLDDATLSKGIGDLGSALAAEARDRTAGDRALSDRADIADAAAGRLAERITGLEGRPVPIPYDDTALSGRVGAVETGVEGLDGRLKTVEGRPVVAPYDGADHIEEHRRYAVGFDPAGRRVLFDSPSRKLEFSFDNVRSCEGSGSAVTQSAFIMSMTTKSHWVDFNVRCPETPIIRVPVSSQMAAARICEWFRLMDEGALPGKRDREPERMAD